MATLETEMAFFEEQRAHLEAENMGKWVVIYGKELVGVFDSFDAAAAVAVERFGRGPYLIRQIGAAPVTLPASAMYVFANAG
jgi:hypothetical protein